MMSGNIYVRENSLNCVLSPRETRFRSMKIIRLSMFSRLTFYLLQRIILVIETSLSEQHEGGPKYCAIIRKMLHIYIYIYSNFIFLILTSFLLINFINQSINQSICLFPSKM